MTDQFVPELTLEPDMATPTLESLNAEPTARQQAFATATELDYNISEDAAKAVAAVVIDENSLTEEERKVVDEFSKKIDIANSNEVLQYGAAAQKNIAEFSSSALNSVKTKDLGEIGADLTTLVNELKGFDATETKGGLFGFFKKQVVSLDSLKTKYDSAEKNVDKIVKALENHQITLMKDVAMFDQMYALNEKYYKELTMYIIAGKKRIAAFQENELAQAKKKAEETGAPEDAQAYNDMVNLLNRFEKKIHDLELTRQISIQMGPQTRLLQNNDTLMIEKIQSSIVNTIPLWKSQMVLALGLEHSKQATKAQNEVTEITNEMLKKNADLLKTSTIETAKEGERSIVDIETLKYTNQQLIDTLNEVMDIQTKGKAARAEAEVELSRLEGELRRKLMELN